MSYESPATRVEHELRDTLAPPRSRGRLWPLVALGVIVVTAISIPGVRWRLEVIGLQVTGRVADMRLSEAVRLIMPAANQPDIAALLVNRNPYAAIHIPSREPSDIAAGAKVFQTECASCHGADANGGPGAPPLFNTEFKHGESEWALYRTVRYGIPKTAMMPHPLGWSRIWQLVAYIRSLGVGADDVSIPPELQQRLGALRVPYLEQAAVVDPATDWLSFSGSYASTRHSALTQITRENVKRLALRWTVQLDDTAQKIETSALAREGMLFVTVPPAKVMALDATNGHRLWLHQHPYERKGGGEGPIGQNRGVAVLDDRVYVGTWDSKLSALDIATGKVVWETTVDPQYPATYISAAPLVFKDLVVVGVGTAPTRSRGFIAAFDAHTGKKRWHFNVIPDPGQPGHDTWPSGDSWRTGGAGPWMTGSYDPESDTLYWGVGGAKPDFDASRRKGDNLYSNSVLALRGSTGQLLWYFQFTPGDTHDWDSTQVPMLVDRTGPQGRERRLLWANRNGFFYILNRETGQFLKGVPFVRQNWAQGLDPLGRPIRAEIPFDQTQGWQVYPGAKGGTNWWPPTYDPALNLVFIPVLEQGMVFFPTAQTLPSTSGRSFYTAIRALDASTGALVWEHKQAPRLIDNDTGGLLSTRGAVVFGSDQTRFFALDARTGQLLWSVETGGTIMAAPTTYLVNGEQMVTVAAGRNLMTFALPSP